MAEQKPTGRPSALLREPSGDMELALIETKDMSRAERTVLRLLGDEPRTYGEIRRRRLKEDGAPAGDKKMLRQALKRVDKELCSGLKRLQHRKMVWRDPGDGRYSIMAGSLQVSFLAHRYQRAQAELIHLIAAGRLSELPPDWDTAPVRRELAEFNLHFLSLLKSNWSDLRRELHVFIEEGDRLFRRVPSKPIKNVYRSRLTRRENVDDLMKELDRISAEIIGRDPTTQNRLSQPGK